VSDLDAASEVAGELSVQGRNDIIRPERQPCGGGDRLLAASGVVAPRDTALAIKDHGAILDGSLQEAEVQELEAQ